MFCTPEGVLGAVQKPNTKQLYLLIIQLSSQNFRGHPVGGAHNGQRLLHDSITAKRPQFPLTSGAHSGSQGQASTVIES